MKVEHNNVAKIERQFEEMVERVSQERTKDKQSLELYIQSFKAKVSSITSFKNLDAYIYFAITISSLTTIQTDDLFQQLESRIRARSDAQDQQIHLAIQQFHMIAKAAKASEDEVNQLKIRMAGIIKKHLESFSE